MHGCVKYKIRYLIEEYEPLLEVARRGKLHQWFDNITSSLAHDVMYGIWGKMQDDEEGQKEHC